MLDTATGASILSGVQVKHFVHAQYAVVGLVPCPPQRNPLLAMHSVRRAAYLKDRPTI